MKRLTSGLMMLTVLILGATPLLARTFDLDPSHSVIEFKVKHMAISKTRGTFGDFTASFDYEPGKPDSWRVEAVIDAASIDTGNEDRDNHLRSEEFLWVEEHPNITFVSTGVELEDEESGKLMGNLTIHGVTQPVVLDLEISGMVDDPWGNTRAGFAAEGSINRKDFGLTWHKALETGGLVVGNKVEIAIEVEGVLRK